VAESANLTYSHNVEIGPDGKVSLSQSARLLVLETQLAYALAGDPILLKHLGETELGQVKTEKHVTEHAFNLGLSTDEILSLLEDRQRNQDVTQLEHTTQPVSNVIDGTVMQVSVHRDAKPPIMSHGGEGAQTQSTTRRDLSSQSDKNGSGGHGGVLTGVPSDISTGDLRGPPEPPPVPMTFAESAERVFQTLFGDAPEGTGTAREPDPMPTPMGVAKPALKRKKRK
jgi:hypothetical protein